MKQNKFKIYTLGCKVNQYDSQDLSRKLISAGFAVADKNADIAIINTCCVTQTAIHKCKRMINKTKKENPEAKIVVMGCWPVAYRDEVEKLDVNLIWGVGELNKLVQQILNFKLSPPQRDPAVAGQITNPATSLRDNGAGKLQITNNKFQNGKSRYFIKIQDGCEQFCSYCIIPYTRGKLRSRAIQEIIAEIEQAVKAGYMEVVLCGIHLGFYGRMGTEFPIGNSVPLLVLLEKLVKIKDLGRIRLSSIEVTEVSDELIKLIADSNNKICKHLHIPLQSGCDKILKLMNRPYDVKYYKNKIKRIRELMPSVSPLISQDGDIAITTDVIVGFPGETEDDFQETYNFVKQMKFSRLHVFPFSVHKKTPAAKMNNKVDESKIEARAKKLRKFSKKLEDNFRKKFVGRELDVVVENVIKNKIKGKSEFYFDLYTRMAVNKKRTITDLIGKIIKVVMK